MKYTSLKSCGELFLLIAEGKSMDEIANWANEELSADCSDAMYDFLSDLLIIDTPGFEMEISEIINRAMGIVKSEQDEICKIYNEFQPR